MSKKKPNHINKEPVGTFTFDEDVIDRITDIVQDDLEVGELDFEQRDSLQRVVMLSISMYLMTLREAACKTTRLTQ